MTEESGESWGLGEDVGGRDGYSGGGSFTCERITVEKHKSWFMLRA